MAACVAGIMNAFTNDDVEIVARNARIHDVSNWAQWFTQPYWPPPFSPDLYRPLTTTLLAFEHLLGGGSPIVYRVGSYALYALLCMCVLRLAQSFLPRAEALGAAALFAAHPVHVEAVALAVGQAELLAGILVLWVVTQYVMWREEGALSARRWIVLSAAYLAACLAKEQALMTPVLLAAAELLIRREGGRRREMLGLVLYLAPVAASVLVLRYLVLGSTAGSFPAEALDGAGLGTRVLTALAMIPRWGRLLVWPAHLQADYSPQEIIASSAVGPREIGGMLTLLLLTAAAWRLRRRVPLFSFGVAWMAITLFPVSNIAVVTGIVLAERALLLPSVGVVLALAALVRVVLSSQRRNPRLVHTCGVAAAIVTVLGIGRSVERQMVWRNEGFLVARTAKDAPLSFRNQRALGDLFFEVGDTARARDAYAKALAYSPAGTRWRVRNSYARALGRLGNLSGAAEQYRLSLSQRPDQEFERAELAVTYLTLGRYQDAASQADSAAMYGGRADIYERLRSIADSAIRVGAPAGTIRVGLERGSVRADR